LPPPPSACSARCVRCGGCGAGGRAGGGGAGDWGERVRGLRGACGCRLCGVAPCCSELCMSQYEFLSEFINCVSHTVRLLARAHAHESCAWVCASHMRL
jgi:hypothetical protein